MLKDKLNDFEQEVWEETIQTLENVCTIMDIGSKFNFSLFDDEVFHLYRILISKSLLEVKKKLSELLEEP